MVNLQRLILLLAGLSSLWAEAQPAGAISETGSQSAWPQWRGPLANGVAPHANPPIHWSETNSVRWKIMLPGKGHSSPIVSGDWVFALSAAPTGPAQKPVFDDAPGVHDSVPVTHRHQFLALAISRRDGKVAWQK